MAPQLSLLLMISERRRLVVAPASAGCLAGVSPAFKVAPFYKTVVN